jgi:hypothetical protein
MMSAWVSERPRLLRTVISGTSSPGFLLKDPYRHTSILSEPTIAPLHQGHHNGKQRFGHFGEVIFSANELAPRYFGGPTKGGPRLNSPAAIRRSR